MDDDFAALEAPPTDAEIRRAAARDRRLSAGEGADLKRQIIDVTSGRGKLNSADFMQPVSQTFICEVFGMRPETVKKRLIKCPKLGTGVAGRDVYDFKTACEYLLKPKMDIATYMKTLNASDMPPIINKVYWEAERTKNKVLIETGEAWRTEDVLDVFGEVFMMVKDRIPLLVEEMRESGLTDAQLAALQSVADNFQKDLHEALVEMPARRQTPSRRAEMEGLIEGMTVDVEDDD